MITDHDATLRFSAPWMKPATWPYEDERPGQDYANIPLYESSRLVFPQWRTRVNGMTVSPILCPNPSHSYSSFGFHWQRMRTHLDDENYYFLSLMRNREEEDAPHYVTQIRVKVDGGIGSDVGGVDKIVLAEGIGGGLWWRGAGDYCWRVSVPYLFREGYYAGASWGTHGGYPVVSVPCIWWRALPSGSPDGCYGVPIGGGSTPYGYSSYARWYWWLPEGGGIVPPDAWTYTEEDGWRSPEGSTWGSNRETTYWDDADDAILTISGGTSPLWWDGFYHS